MLEFVVRPLGLELRYRSDRVANGWVWKALREDDSAKVGRMFEFEQRDLLNPPDEEDDEGENDDYIYRFRFAKRQDGYFHIEGRVLGIDNPVLIADSGLKVSRKLFVAERDISIFGRIADLIPAGQPIVVGGDRDDAIPIPDFKALLANFPNTGELNRYAAARVATVIGDYLEPLRDAREQYEAYLNRRRSTLGEQSLRQPELLRTELEKYVLIRDTLVEWLAGADTRSEDDWQQMILQFLLLIFPKYVAVLGKVRIPDAYSTPGVMRIREIDLVLVDAGGALDIIEIKKPFENAVLARKPYRDNHVPAKELAGGIMQAEKYLFHLSKWGLAGEKALTERYREALPPGLSIRIANPKAMIILGRDPRPAEDSPTAASQALDLEIIKRKYANMIDILTYNDLIRRLNNIIAALQRRAEAEEPIP